MRLEWDNGSEDEKKLGGVPTYVKCKQACQDDEECMQWYFYKDKCNLARRIMYGKAKTSEKGGVKAFSGWMMERIAEFEEENRECKPKWTRE